MAGANAELDAPIGGDNECTGKFAVEQIHFESRFNRICIQ